MRAWSGVGLTLLVGCSFVDDFDKFRAYDAGAADGDVSATVSPSEPADADGTSPPEDDPAAEDDARADEPGLDAGSTQTRADAGKPTDAARSEAGGVTEAGNFTEAGGVTEAGSPSCGSSCSEAGVSDAEPALCPGPLRRCFPDRDGDGWADLQEPRMLCACSQPLIEVSDTIDDPGVRQAKHDCWDADDPNAKSVHPGQTEFFDQPYHKPGAAPSYDYDCRNGAEPKFTKTLPADGCQGLLNAVLCQDATGFLEPLPRCGEVGVYTTCSGGVVSLGCNGANESRKQPCR